MYTQQNAIWTKTVLKENQSCAKHSYYNKTKCDDTLTKHSCPFDSENIAEWGVSQKDPKSQKIRKFFIRLSLKNIRDYKWSPTIMTAQAWPEQGQLQ